MPTSDDSDAAFAEGAITLWANFLTLMGTHMVDSGTSREEVLGMLRMLHETNEETIPSPRARASASRHLMAVYRALAQA